MTDLTAKEMRQLEVDSYEANIAMYKTLLTKLDGNWDSDLIHLKDLPPHDAAEKCPLNRIERLAELQQFDLYNRLLRTEILECSKAKAILSVL
jgi:hypothetical protein